MPSNVHLSENQRQTLVLALQTQLEALKRQNTQHLDGLSHTEHAQQALLQDADDLVQRAAVHEVEATIADIENLEFAAVSQALARIHSADYGLCMDCQMPIPFERLSVEPQALRCVACETSHEGEI